MHSYIGAKVAIATKHGKKELIAPAFQQLQIDLQQAGVDTDLLGTFTGEVPRSGSARETAIKKACLGMEALELSYGIASEGSYGSDAQIPILSSGIELLAWVDEEREIEIVESHRSFDIQAASKSLHRGERFVDYIEEFKLPSHAVIVRSPESEKPLIFKGLHTINEVETALEKCWADSEIAIVENDLRAHLNPTRQQAIAAVAAKLAQRLLQLCPNCQTPGWGVTDVLRGAECEECGEFDASYPIGEILGCALCDFQENRELGKKEFKARDCVICNP